MAEMFMPAEVAVVLVDERTGEEVQVPPGLISRVTLRPGPGRGDVKVTLEGLWIDYLKRLDEPPSQYPEIRS